MSLAENEFFSLTNLFSIERIYSLTSLGSLISPEYPIMDNPLVDSYFQYTLKRHHKQ